MTFAICDPEASDAIFKSAFLYEHVFLFQQAKIYFLSQQSKLNKVPPLKTSGWQGSC